MGENKALLVDFFVLYPWHSFIRAMHSQNIWMVEVKSLITTLLQYILIQNIPAESKAAHLIKNICTQRERGEGEKKERKDFGGIMMPYSFPISIFQIVPLFVTPGGFYTLRQCIIVRWLRGMPLFCFWTSGA